MEKITKQFIQTRRIDKLLSEYNFEFKYSVDVSLKCEICKCILNNARQAQCGCRFCSKCISRLVKDGNRFCNGSGILCKELILPDDITEIPIDHRANREIMDLIVNCPEPLCKHQDKLVHMEEHLRLCQKDNRKCPFYEVGCGIKKLTNDKIGAHLQQEISSHSEMLIEIIKNSKNEIAGLIRNGEKSQRETDALKESLRKKEEVIESIQVQVIHLTNIYTEKFDRIVEEIKTEINEINTNFKKILGNNVSSDSHARPIDSNQYLENKAKETTGYILWKIEKLSERKRKGRWNKSSYFSILDNQYKLRLTLWANGYGSVIGTGISIFLMVESSTNDADLKWPLAAKIHMKITNKYSPDLNKTLSQFIQIKRPQLNYFNCSEPFNFSYNELDNIGLLRNDMFIIECFVSLQ